MSVYSMTGFGKGEAVGENYTLVTEIKTVNNRFKDFKFRMSSLFNCIELELRSKLEAEFKRGSFDVSISYKKNEKPQAEFHVDPKKVESFIDLMKPIFENKKVAFQVSPVEFMRSDFYKEEEQGREEEMLPLVKASFDKALAALKLSRAAEGEKLATKLLEHLANYETSFAKVEETKNIYQEMVRENLTNKLNDKIKDLKVDESRFLQEVIYYLEKLDIDEEITRAKIHVAKLKNILKGSGEIGRQIDFLLQELGRETNTMGSKSAHPDISNNVVEMKVQLEKIREQALNLE